MTATYSQPTDTVLQPLPRRRSKSFYAGVLKHSFRGNVVMKETRDPASGLRGLRVTLTYQGEARVLADLLETPAQDPEAWKDLPRLACEAALLTGKLKPLWNQDGSVGFERLP